MNEVEMELNKLAAELEGRAVDHPGVSLCVKSRKFEYKLDIERKYTILQGNSATGKSSLVNLIDEYTQGSNLVTVECNVSIRTRIEPFGNLDDLNKFLSDQTGAIVLDEHCLLNCNVSSSQLATIFKQHKLYFILISRESQIFKAISVSVYDMYGLVSEDGITRLQRLYDEESITQSIDVDCIITEDRKSGAKFMRTYFPEFEVESAGGRNNISNTILKNRDKSLFVFYDALSAGFIEADIQNVKAVCSKQVYLYRPLSFEKYLLDSPFLHSIHYEDDGLLEDLEDYYTSVLKNILPHGYNKSTLPACIKYDCIMAINEGYKYCNNCRLQNCSRSKRDLVIYDALSCLRRN